MKVSRTKDGKTPDTLTALDPGEEYILTIRRHPAGILGIYMVCGLIAIATGILAFGLGSNIFTADNESTVLLGSLLVFVIVAAICVGVAAVATAIYRANVWILTSDCLVQVRYAGLFRRDSSQLALEHIEDVTAEQHGMLPELLNYGVVKVEIPGESDKFVFPFCPDPNYYAKRILQTTEAATRQPANSSPASTPVASYEVPDGTD